MGGYDGQTFAGVMSTATHGSGVAFGPLASFVRSIDLVAAGGVVHRIEPRDGITDADAYRAAHPDRVIERTTSCSTRSSSAWACSASCTR